MLSSKYWILCLVKKNHVYILCKKKKCFHRNEKCFTENEIHRTKREKLISQVSKHLIKKENKKNQDGMTETSWVREDAEVPGEWCAQAAPCM